MGDYFFQRYSIHLTKVYMTFCVHLTSMLISEETLDGYLIEVPSSFGNYEYIRTLGCGSSSVVALAKDIINSREVACKFVSREYLASNDKMRYFEAELRISQRLRFPYIIETYEVLYLEKYIVVVMEYCVKGDLLAYIMNNGPLATQRIKLMFEEIVLAVDYMHERNIAHRDIKPENIFLDHEFNIKIGDFGLSQQLKIGAWSHTLCGTICYTAPEILTADQYDPKKADIWSLGILLFSMITRMLPWRNETPSLLVEQIVKGKIVLPPCIPNIIARIITECTAINPKLRPNTKELLQSPWFLSFQSVIVKQRNQIKSSATINTPSKHLSLKILRSPIVHVNTDRRRLTRPCLTCLK